jgi:hypothetical protein
VFWVLSFSLIKKKFPGRIFFSIAFLFFTHCFIFNICDDNLMLWPHLISRIYTIEYLKYDKVQLLLSLPSVLKCIKWEETPLISLPHLLSQKKPLCQAILISYVRV